MCDNDTGKYRFISHLMPSAITNEYFVDTFRLISKLSSSVVEKIYIYTAFKIKYSCKNVEAKLVLSMYDSQ